MKRDKQLLCQILRHYEVQPGYGDLANPQLPNVSSETLEYHLHLAVQAGFLEASTPENRRDAVLPVYHVHGLTWEGHELLHPNGCQA